MLQRAKFLLAGLLATILFAGCGGQDTPVEQAEEEAGVEEITQSPQEEFSTASPKRKAELQAEAQQAEVFKGEHEDLSLGDAAHWTSGFNLQLGPEAWTATPDATSGNSNPQRTVVLGVTITQDEDATTTIPFSGVESPCKARDQNGIPLKQGKVSLTNPPDAQIFQTPLEPGQERTAHRQYEVPESTTEVRVLCSLALLRTGAPEPPPAATATWVFDPDELEFIGKDEAGRRPSVK